LEHRGRPARRPVAGRFASRDGRGSSKHRDVEVGHGTGGSVGRVFVACAAIAMVPVIVLGLVLAANYRSETARRGLAEGRAEAALVAGTAVAPALDGHLLAAGLTPAEQASLVRIAGGAVRDGSVLRLRLRDLVGRVIFSDDGSGLASVADDEAVNAA